MSEIFSQDSLFIKIMNRAGDVLMLSIIFTICSIPIFTIGASITALSYTTMRGLKYEDGYTWKYFLKSFKENFKQSTVIWLVMVVVFFVFGVDIWYWREFSKVNEGQIGNIMQIISVVLISLAVMIFLYVFPLQAKFDNRIKVQFRNAFLLSIRYFPTTLVIALMYAAGALFFYLQPILAFFTYVLFGVGIVGFIHSYFMLKCFKPFLEPAPEEGELDEDEAEDDDEASDEETDEETDEDTDEDTDTAEDKAANVAEEKVLETEDSFDKKNVSETEASLEQADFGERKKSIVLTDAKEDEDKRIKEEIEAKERAVEEAAKKADMEAKKVAEDLALKVKENVTYETSGENVYRREKNTQDTKRQGSSGKKQPNKKNRK